MEPPPEKGKARYIMTTTTSPETTPVVKPAAWMTLDQALAIVTQFGLEFKAQSGFVKVFGPKGNQVYIANTKTVRRIDISGFECDPSVAQVPHTGPFGNVKQQVRLAGYSVQEQMSNLHVVLETMVHQPAKVKAPKAKAEKAPAQDKAEVAAPAAVVDAKVLGLKTTSPEEFLVAKAAYEAEKAAEAAAKAQASSQS